MKVKHESVCAAVSYLEPQGYEVVSEGGCDVLMRHTESYQNRGADGAMYATIWKSRDGFVYSETY